MVKVLTLSLALLVPAPLWAQSASANPLLGAAACAVCHPAAFQQWKSSPHAQANSRLPRENRSDSRCLRCHGTADGESGGVQCESCHGAGRIYAKRYVMKDKELSRLVGLVDAKLDDCRRCHTDTSPRLRAFLPEQAWQAIRHVGEPKLEAKNP